MYLFLHREYETALYIVFISDYQTGFNMEYELALAMEQEAKFDKQLTCTLNNELNLNNLENELTIGNVKSGINTIDDILKQQKNSNIPNTQINIELMTNISNKLPKMQQIYDKLKKNINKSNQPLNIIKNNIKSYEKKINILKQSIEKRMEIKQETEDKISVLKKYMMRNINYDKMKYVRHKNT